MTTPRRARIGSVAKVTSGHPFRSDQWTPDGVPAVKIANVKDGYIDLDTAPAFVSMEDSQTVGRFLLQQGDIVISMTGDVGRVARIIIDSPLVLNQRVGLFTVDSTKADPLFFFYTLRTTPVRQEIVRTAFGSAQANTSPSLIEQVQIPLPPLDTQRAIAEVLGALDDKIAANHHLSQVIDDLASSLFQKRFKHAPSAPLTSIAKVNTTSISPQSEGEFRYLDISLVGNGTSESPTLTTWAEAPSRARRGVPAGSTIWSTVRPNRRSHCLILDEDPILVASTGFAVLTPSECGPAFLYETTKQKSFQDYLESVAEGSAYPAVRSSEFAKAPVTSATREERNAFEEEAGPLRALQASLERENQVLASTRDELLPLLMSGRITVGAASSRVEEVV